MQFFRRNRSQASISGPVEAPSHEPIPAFAPPADPFDPSPRRLSHHQRLSISSDSHSLHDHRHSVNRSQSQRSPTAAAPSPPAARPTVSLVAPVSPLPAPSVDADSEQSWPSPAPDASHRLDREPRKSRRSLFALHQSSARDNAGFLGRNRSVRNQSHHARQQSSPEQQHHHHRLADDRAAAQGDRRPRPESAGEEDLESPIPRSPVRSPYESNPSIERANAERFYQQRGESDSLHSQVSLHRWPRFREDITPQHPPFHAIEIPPRGSSLAHTPRPPQMPPDQLSLHRHSPQSDLYGPRPSSQQSLGPPSPLHPQHHSSDPKLQNPSRQPSLQPSAPTGGMTSPERPTGLRQPAESAQQQPSQPKSGSQASGPPQRSSSKDDTSQQGRDTPPPQNKDDAGEVDVRALQQKHEELRTCSNFFSDTSCFDDVCCEIAADFFFFFLFAEAKYNKVKRYYFDREAQVQNLQKTVEHLQNTVAHQRMAFSRTVLDDNEYTSRFNRLDGAVKELAFSLRKHWKSVPTWLQAYVNEDAHTVGTKEMTAVGRAVITRWLVDEIFERHFHPGLEPNLSVQLKNIEMNLRRQQAKAYTEEDRENVITRISNWRRTTLDGLDDVLQSKAAQDCRTQLIDHLVEKLAASLEMHLKDPAPPDLGSGARMIVENAIGIAEKIPLESRDVCVEYFPPGTPVTETLMKVETTLPPLSKPGQDPPSLAQEPSPADREKGPMSQEGDGQDEDVDVDGDTGKDASSASTAASSPDGTSFSPSQQREQRKRSVFGNLIGKKANAQAQQEPTPSREAKESLEAQGNSGSPARIRFAAFMAVEVQGKGATNVLIKAPVYPIES